MAAAMAICSSVAASTTQLSKDSKKKRKLARNANGGSERLGGGQFGSRCRGKEMRRILKEAPAKAVESELSTRRRITCPGQHIGRSIREPLRIPQDHISGPRWRNGIPQPGSQFHFQGRWRSTSLSIVLVLLLDPGFPTSFTFI